MGAILNRRELALNELDEAVATAAAYFSNQEKHVSDGQASAYGVLAQLVFWHEEYINIVRDLAAGREPVLLEGAFKDLNARARIQYRGNSMVMLASRFKDLQRQLRRELDHLEDWTQNFPIKFDSLPYTVEARVLEITQHIQNHVKRFRRQETDLKHYK